MMTDSFVDITSHGDSNAHSAAHDTEHIAKIEHETWREALRVERIANLFRILVAPIGFILVLISDNTIPEQSLRSVYIGISVIMLHAILLAFVFYTPIATKTNSKLLRITRYISSAIDILTVSMVLWLLGDYRTFKSHISLFYYLFIALAAYRYSRPLTLFSAAVASSSYLGMFLFSYFTGRIVVGGLSAEYVGPVISVTGILIKITVITLISMVLSSTAKGYANVITRVVKSELRSAHQRQNAQNMRQLLMRYFTKEVAEYIINGGHTLLGERREVTVMFCDFRDFTKLSNKMPTEEVVMILNRYLSRLVDAIFTHNGTLDKYTGDGFMAVFGAPLNKGDDTYNALSAALELKRCVQDLNVEHSNKLPKGLGVGISLCTGEVIAGNIGSEKRLEYTVIGEPVNIASRLESLNKRLRTTILLAESTYKKSQNRIDVRDRGPFKIRGISGQMQVFELLGIRESMNA